MLMLRKCKWCGEELQYLYKAENDPLVYDDVDHVALCELEELRKLRNQLVAFAVEPYKNTDTPDVKLLDWNTLGPIIDRACELKFKQASEDEA